LHKEVAAALSMHYARTMQDFEPGGHVESSQFTCRRCNRLLRPGATDFYLISILAVADPSPPIITEEDLARNVHAEIGRLVKSMENLSEQDAQDQVFRRVGFRLCPQCYQVWIADPTGR
jgi:hypothetical protein